MYWYVLICIGMIWYVLICIDMIWLYWYDLIWFDMYWYVLICIGMYWYKLIVLICIDMIWYVLMCVDLYLTGFMVIAFREIVSLLCHKEEPVGSKSWSQPLWVYKMALPGIFSVPKKWDTILYTLSIFVDQIFFCGWMTKLIT